MSYKKIDYTKLNGFGLTQDALDFLQIGNASDFSALAKLLGDKVILYGVKDEGASVTDGYVIYGGELLPFVGGAKAAKVYVETLTDVELFGDSSLQTVYFTKRLRMGNVGDFDLSDLKKAKTDGLNIDDSDVFASAKAVKKLYDYMLSMLQFETTIVLSGCVVSNIVGGAFDLSAGVVMIDNNIVKTQAYSGVFPAYIKPDGTVVNAAPAGSYIMFDPHTSQRYADVLKRATTSVGEIKTFKVLSDRFDINGVGKWEMQGFKICDDMQSRVPVGYDRRQVDPVDNVWDANHTNAGNAGGEKTIKIQWQNLPSQVGGNCAPGEAGLIKNSNFGENKTISNAVDSVNSGQQPNIVDTPQKLNLGGADVPLENRQPYRIVVFAERI